MDLVLNNLQRLLRHNPNQPTNQHGFHGVCPTNVKCMKSRVKDITKKKKNKFKKIKCINIVSDKDNSTVKFF